MPLQTNTLKEYREQQQWECTLCSTNGLDGNQLDKHKQQYHSDRAGYGIMWFNPFNSSFDSTHASEAFHQDQEKYVAGKHSMWDSRLMQMMLPVQNIAPVTLGEGNVPVIESEYLAKTLGVKKVYVRNEGANPTGSMKDYLMTCGVTLARQLGHNNITVVSCGNYAVSAATYITSIGGKAVLFVPGKTTKKHILSAIDGTTTFYVDTKEGQRDALFEEVYEAFAGLQHPALYNLNVSNEFLLDGIKLVSVETALAGIELPTHFLSGAGNGTYIAGVGKGFHELKRLGLISHLPKVVAVGMRGGFPLEDALKQGKPILEYKDFKVNEELINGAEGCMAIGSYSMPQAVRAIHLTNGLTLGDLTNKELADAYTFLSHDNALLAASAVPEPTGIMSLAAALAHKTQFSSDDVLMLAFTGSAIREISEVERLIDTYAEGDDSVKSRLINAATSNRRISSVKIQETISADKLSEMISQILGGK